jgi:NTP pyrophosphatase (non-canonical NTP hydrolase)
MTITELQEKTDMWINQYGVRYFSELTNTTLLMEEVGELARLMSRIYGEQSFKIPLPANEQKARIADEMADIIFVLTCLANQTGVDLSEAIERNLKKKTNRDFDRHIKNKKL